MRHPGYLMPTHLWSHHEKMVVVDQHIGFLGGLDLCYGRMDSNAHNLTDPGTKHGDEELFWWPGIDYSNVRIKDFV